jgi:hypothetical protein
MAEKKQNFSISGKQAFKKQKVLTVLTVLMVLTGSGVKFLRKNGFNGFSVI